LGRKRFIPRKKRPTNNSRGDNANGKGCKWIKEMGKARRKTHLQRLYGLYVWRSIVWIAKKKSKPLEKNWGGHGRDGRGARLGKGTRGVRIKGENGSVLKKGKTEKRLGDQPVKELRKKQPD